MRYLSLCSGIEAASVAWHPLGWEAVAFAEIDPFPSAVLKHRFPNVPNWGDMSKFEEWPDVSIDLVCGGTPCQSFSVAGLRKGLDDPRGNLMLTFGHILAKYRPRWFVWENVPGVLSSDEGRDFASFLGLVTGQAIEPPADGWRNTGFVSGIDSAYGIAYRVLDAQYTRSPKYPRAVPQRRRRVFVVGHLGDWRRAAAVLLDSESLSGDPPPSRKAGQGTSGIAQAGIGSRGFTGTSFGQYQEGCGTLRAEGGDLGGGSETVIVADVSPTLCSHSGPHGRNNPINEAFVAEVAPTLSSSGTGVSRPGFNSEDQWFVAHTLKGEGFDASEDGTGRGTPIVPAKWPAEVAPTLNAHFGDKQGLEDQHALNGGGLFVPCEPVAIQGTIIGRGENAGPQGSGASEDGVMFTLTKTDQHAIAVRTANTNANGHGIAEEVAHTLDGAQGQAVAFTCKDSGQDAGDVAPTLRSMNHADSHQNGGGQVAVAFNARQDPDSGPVTHPLDTDGYSIGVLSQMAVRRLTPAECEKLQAFPTGWTNVPYRGKDGSPDGPRYKACGNSFATNVVEWIGIRIEIVEEITSDERLVK